MNTIETIILSLGGSAAIAAALMKWSSNLIQTKITMSWDQRNKTEIELLKGNLQSNQEVVKLAISSLTSNNQKLLEKQLVAVEEAWSQILYLRESLTSIRRYYSVFEFSLNKPDMETFLNSFDFTPLDNSMFEKLIQDNKKLETYRPYLGEYIWSLFNFYRAFVLRIHFKFEDDYNKGEVKPWHVDESLVGMVVNSLGPDRYEQIDLNSPNSLNQVCTMLETGILSEIEKLISGSNSTEKNYKEARRLMELASEELLQMNKVRDSNKNKVVV